MPLFDGSLNEWIRKQLPGMCLNLPAAGKVKIADATESVAYAHTGKSVIICDQTVEHGRKVRLTYEHMNEDTIQAGLCKLISAVWATIYKIVGIPEYPGLDDTARISRYEAAIILKAEAGVKAEKAARARDREEAARQDRARAAVEGRAKAAAERVAGKKVCTLLRAGNENVLTLINSDCSLVFTDGGHSGRTVKSASEGTCNPEIVKKFQEDGICAPWSGERRPFAGYDLFVLRLKLRNHPNTGLSTVVTPSLTGEEAGVTRVECRVSSRVIAVLNFGISTQDWLQPHIDDMMEEMTFPAHASSAPPSTRGLTYRELEFMKGKGLEGKTGEQLFYQLVCLRAYSIRHAQSLEAESPEPAAAPRADFSPPRAGGKRARGPPQEPIMREIPVPVIEPPRPAEPLTPVQIDLVFERKASGDDPNPPISVLWESGKLKVSGGGTCEWEFPYASEPSSPTSAIAESVGKLFPGGMCLNLEGAAGQVITPTHSVGSFGPSGRGIECDQVSLTGGLPIRLKYVHKTGKYMGHKLCELILAVGATIGTIVPPNPTI